MRQPKMEGKLWNFFKSKEVNNITKQQISKLDQVHR